MGLDMYLFKTKPIGALTPEQTMNFQFDPHRYGPRYKIELSQRHPPEEVAYWRKANAIHAWLNQQAVTDKKHEPYQPFLVSSLLLEQLCQVIQQLLTKQKEIIQGDISLVTKLLPTAGGFFFGSEKYDQNYFQILLSTYEQLQEVLQNLKAPELLYYWCSYLELDLRLDQEDVIQHLTNETHQIMKPFKMDPDLNADQNIEQWFVKEKITHLSPQYLTILGWEKARPEIELQAHYPTFHVYVLDRLLNPQESMILHSLYGDSRIAKIEGNPPRSAFLIPRESKEEVVSKVSPKTKPVRIRGKKEIHVR